MGKEHLYLRKSEILDCANFLTWRRSEVMGGWLETDGRQQLNTSDREWDVLGGFAPLGELRQMTEALETDPWTSGPRTCHEESPNMRAGRRLSLHFALGISRRHTRSAFSCLLCLLVPISSHSQGLGPSSNLLGR